MKQSRQIIWKINIGTYQRLVAALLKEYSVELMSYFNFRKSYKNIAIFICHIIFYQNYVHKFDFQK